MGKTGPERLAELLDHNGAALVLYAQQWCETPEDVVQEALLQLVRLRSAPDNKVGWLYRVVRNGAISAARSAARRRMRETATHRGEPWFAATENERLDAAEAAEALGQLPIEQREVIVARLWGGLPWKQVAELSGSSISTVRRRYEAGLSLLRKRLGVPCPQTKVERT
jgi:RNA polymerase sigma-70 factor (ECF subfamily)